MQLPVRKRARLQTYDYRQNGAYFITVCTQRRKNVFWISDDSNTLSVYGKIVASAVEQISQNYPEILVDRYVVMPDHVHLLLNIHGANQTSISTVVNQLKGYITKQIGFSIWQKGFYDHIIRDEDDYIKRWNYIEDNPARWMETH